MIFNCYYKKQISKTNNKYQIEINNWLKKCRKITLPHLKDKQSLINLLKQLFSLNEQEIVGITDSKGKFHDLQYFLFNLQTFNKQIIELVISTTINHQQESFPTIGDQNQFNIEPISFASNTPNEFQNDYNPLNGDSQIYEHIDFPEQAESEIIAQIHDLKIFEETFLDDDITIVVESSKKLDHLSFPHYHLKGKNKKIYIYQNQKKICQLPVLSQNWKQTEKIVLNVLQSFEQTQIQQSEHKDQNEVNFFATQPEIDLVHQRRKSHPSQQKIRPSRGHSKRQSKERKNCQFQKQKKPQQRKFQFFQRKQSRSQQSQKAQRHDIPIIIRKSNNQIQKVTASYPLSHEQMQAINSLLELQIQGLFTDDQINKVKMMVLGQNDTILKLFKQFSNQKFNIGQLSKSIALIVRKKQTLKK